MHHYTVKLPFNGGKKKIIYSARSKEYSNQVNSTTTKYINGRFAEL